MYGQIDKVRAGCYYSPRSPILRLTALNHCMSLATSEDIDCFQGEPRVSLPYPVLPSGPAALHGAHVAVGAGIPLRRHLQAWRTRATPCRPPRDPLDPRDGAWPARPEAVSLKQLPHQH